MFSRLVVTLLVAGLGLSCTGSSIDSEGMKDQAPQPHLTCRGAAWVLEEPGPRYTEVGADIGFVALPSLEYEMELGRWAPENSFHEGYRFAKFGLIVRRFRQVYLEIVNAPGDALFDYSAERVLHDAMTVGPCDTVGIACVAERSEDLSDDACGTDRGDWLAWPGGIWVDEPGCVEALVSSDGERVPVLLAVGAPCNEADARS